MLNLTTTLTWSPWLPLESCWHGTTIQAAPGLYRIRRVGTDGIDYIRQTGTGTMTLRKRLAMLRGAFGPEMPYRDPHTAGPALWALRQATACSFEVATLVVTGSDTWRKGLEALATARYRQETGTSPTGNFGRMPPGYRISSGNNATLKAQGKLVRGEPVAGELPVLTSLPPAGPLTGEPVAAD